MFWHTVGDMFLVFCKSVLTVGVLLTSVYLLTEVHKEEGWEAFSTGFAGVIMIALFLLFLWSQV